MTLPAITPLTSERLFLEPLAVGHAEVMAEVLADSTLYEFTGGQAPTVDDLRRRYTAQVVGRSADVSEGWFNWVLQLRDTGAAVGFVQATVYTGGPTPVAELAWVVTPAVQGAGLASEAALLVQSWLRRCDIHHFTAHIHPQHAASMGVARRLGMRASTVVTDGETRWRSA